MIALPITDKKQAADGPIVKWKVPSAELLLGRSCNDGR